jgi:hypothetical protein
MPRKLAVIGWELPGYLPCLAPKNNKKEGVVTLR